VVLDGHFKAECYISGSDIEDYNLNYLAKETPLFGSTPTFTSNRVGNKELHKRLYGVKKLVTPSDNSILWTVPVPWLKINSVEVIGAVDLITADFLVKDSPEGVFSGVPNLVLDQFAEKVVLSKDFYNDYSEYDANLYQGMSCEILFYDLPQAGIALGVNFMCHEVL
jgi:hypothetical protein